MDKFNGLLLATLSLQMMGLMLLIKKRRKHKRWEHRRWWVHPINYDRDITGSFDLLILQLRDDEQLFFRYTRMSVIVFDQLLAKISPFITKHSHRKPLSPEQRLFITLRYLSTGDEILSIALQFHVGESTVRKIIHETCTVLTNVLAPIYLKPPNRNDWLDILQGFYRRWNMPNCLGAIDGKHVLIRAPPNSGSLYFNYKKTFSLVLLAVCDHQYKFTLTDIGAYGSESDGGIFNRSNIGTALYNDALDFPPGVSMLPGSRIEMYPFFVGDDAFPLSRYLMKPYPGRGLDWTKKIFNYRLSRARRIIENAFGILVSRWRVFTKPIYSTPNKVEKIITACVCLHNYIITTESQTSNHRHMYAASSYIDREDSQGNITRGQWRNSGAPYLQPLAKTSAHRATVEATQQRDNLCKWFTSPEGEVPWQYEYICRGQYGDHRLPTHPL